MKKCKVIISSLSVMLLFSFSANVAISWDVLDNGGGMSSSSNYALSSSIGQTAIGKSVSANYALNAGYLYAPLLLKPWTSPGGLMRGQLPGDIDNNRAVTIAEVIKAVNIFLNSTDPVLPKVDFNCDGSFLTNELLLTINSFLATDNDGDRMSSSWEIVHGLNSFVVLLFSTVAAQAAVNIDLIDATCSPVSTVSVELRLNSGGEPR
jgi:hypothetical protein